MVAAHAYALERPLKRFELLFQLGSVLSWNELNGCMVLYGNGPMLGLMKVLGMHHYYDYMRPLTAATAGRHLGVDTSLFWAWPKFEALYHHSIVLDTDVIVQCRLPKTSVCVAALEPGVYEIPTYVPADGDYTAPAWLRKQGRLQMYNTSVLSFAGDPYLKSKYIEAAEGYMRAWSRSASPRPFIAAEAMCIAEQVMLHDFLAHHQIAPQLAVNLEGNCFEGMPLPLSHLGSRKKAADGPGTVELAKVLLNLFPHAHHTIRKILTHGHD